MQVRDVAFNISRKELPGKKPGSSQKQYLECKRFKLGIQAGTMGRIGAGAELRSHHTID